MCADWSSFEHKQPANMWCLPTHYCLDLPYAVAVVVSPKLYTQRYNYSHCARQVHTTCELADTCCCSQVTLHCTLPLPLPLTKWLH